MKMVKISPSPHMELYVRATEQMEKDFRKGRRLAAKKGDGADCSTCSWKDMVLDNGSQEIAACTLPKVQEMLMEEQ